MKRKASEVVAAAGPKKGRKPDFTGTPGELVPLAGLALHWGNRLRVSPYDALLEQLEAAPAGTGLKFADVKARASVIVRAKKKGLRVSFAELDGVLYVRLDGHVDDDVKGYRRDAIRTALKASAGGSTAIQLAALLRSKNDTTVDALIVGSILVQMQRSGEVVRGEGDVWRLNPLAIKRAS